MNRDYKYRFISKMGMPNRFGCIEYLGAISNCGYGNFDIDRKSYAAHKISYELFVGKIPKGKLVLHKCDNRQCVAPQHLFLGTQADNIKDMVQKKRNRCGIGEKHGNSKLTDRQVLKIRKLLLEGKTSTEISKIYKVSYASVRDIKYKRTWKHVK